jgi:hypothetical protein
MKAMSRKETVKTQVDLDTDTIITDFLNAQSLKTKKTYTCNFKKVIEYSGQTGKEILADSEGWSRKIFAFQQWLIAQKYSLSTIQSQVGMLRGFFSFYHKPLAFSKAETRKLNRKGRNSEDYLFLQTDIKKLSDIGSLKEKYVVLVGASFGLRAEDFCRLTYGQYRRAIERSNEVPIPLDPVNTAKEEVLAHPFISSDALPIIQSILDSNKDCKDDDLVFAENPQQLTSILQNLGFKAGIDAHGQRVRFHNLRKYLFSKLNTVSSSEQSKMIIGKKVSGSDAVYLNTDSLRDVYTKAMPLICVSNGNGETKKRVVVLEEENSKLKEEIVRLRDTQNRMFSIFNEEQKAQAKTLIPSSEKNVHFLKGRKKTETEQLDNDDIVGLKALISTFKRMSQTEQPKRLGGEKP